MDRFDAALSLSEALLADPLPDRWRHVQAVAAQADRLVSVADVDGDDLRIAAVLHDIGYSPAIAHAQFHPLDGARFLDAEGYPERVVALVARHSCAIVEADLRGITGVEEFHDEQSPTRDALWYCDAVIGPQGQLLSPDDRWTEIRRRYGAHSLVGRFLDEAEPQLREAVHRTEARMRVAGVVL
ncbi:HDIG domain-containing protein [Actinomycetospora endophytica]|uniref:HDIG domain-containing protein n=1 Tax=Actinomycetospora endophytica TaxID=2291215 RepID=A0ABS8PHF8_9PSEU|nr:HD domain-containing protein [Actinomycetospora endophytica]MCD2197680.1 HDIG domain-containing protein [Actinomycetospora endophytica]